MGKINQLPRGAAYESPDVSDNAYADGRVAEETIKRIRAAQEHRKATREPFFIVAGFVRPHLPFSAPKKYWDLYDPHRLPLPELETPPQDAPPIAGKTGGEIVAYKPVPEGTGATYPMELKRKLIHGYYASTTYMDAQFGKVMDEVNHLGLLSNTVVVLWSDHGYHLGDHGIWTKHTNYEQANRIPLIIHAPGVTISGTSTRQLAETVDLYPTLAELAGLPAPMGPQPIDGKSLVPVLRDPKQRVRDHAFHAYPRQRMGRAIRTERYRLVEWKASGAPTDSAALELYDYELDPLEKKNLAKSQPETVEQLRQILSGYPEAVPQ